jgi:hypothetical protein
MCRERIAEKVGCAPETVSRLSEALAKWGYIAKDFNKIPGHWGWCTYRVLKNWFVPQKVAVKKLVERYTLKMSHLYNNVLFLTQRVIRNYTSKEELRRLISILFPQRETRRTNNMESSTNFQRFRRFTPNSSVRSSNERYSGQRPVQPPHIHVTPAETKAQEALITSRMGYTFVDGIVQIPPSSGKSTYKEILSPCHTQETPRRWMAEENPEEEDTTPVLPVFNPHR